MLIKKEFFINLLISIIPITFIAGNLLLNLNILLIIIFALFFFRLKIFEKKFTILDKFLLLFFLYIVVNGAINDYFNYDNSSKVFIKSLSYLRFLLLYFILKFFIQKNYINYKYIFFFFLSVCIFV